MAITTTPRLGLTTWSDDSDEWSREDWENNNTSLDALTAIDIQVATLGARPAASIRGRYCFVTGTGKLYRDSGSSWTEIPMAGTYTLDTVPVAVADVDLGGNRIGNLDDGADMADAATVGQLLTVATRAAISGEEPPAWNPSGASVALGGDGSFVAGNLVETVREFRYGTFSMLHGVLTIGSTTVLGAGPLTLTLPADEVLPVLVADCWYRDDSTGDVWEGFAYGDGTTTASLFVRNATGKATAVTPTVPFTFTTDDQITFRLPLELDPATI